MTPTENEGTVAVDAAARVLLEAKNRELGELGAPADSLRGWDDLQPLEKHAAREYVLPLVWAALEALPDRAAEAWDRAHGDMCGAGPSCNSHRNPYRG